MAELETNPTLQEAENKLIQALKDFPDLSSDQAKEVLEKILKTIDGREELANLFLKLRVYLFERSQNFHESFKLHLQDAELRNGIFAWINQKFAQLDRPVEDDDRLSELKELVAVNMRKLIEISDDQTVQLIERWFDDSFSDHLIVKELSEFPILQFNFLLKYLHFNEVSIKITINEASYQQKDKQNQMEKYTTYLCLFVEQMCKINQTQPEIVDESLIEAYVKKDYYPIEQCMEICQRYRQQRAIAVLQERNQDLKGAIETNMSYLMH